MTRLPPLDPAVREIRTAVRKALLTVPEIAAWQARASESESISTDEAPMVLVALSGGADSLALTAATVFVAEKLRIRAEFVVVDHCLQEDSDQVAMTALEQAVDLGMHGKIVEGVVSADDSDGLEAAARKARYAALELQATIEDACAVLTGHTMNDQAEQVLLGLLRGSGTRSLAGIPPRSVFQRVDLDSLRGEKDLDEAETKECLLLRPMLGITREQTEAACAAYSLTPWQDPHNKDTKFTRVLIREKVLPMLEQELGEHLVQNLANTAMLAAHDADALDAFADACLADTINEFYIGYAELRAEQLAEHLPAARTRVLKLVISRVTGRSLGFAHLQTIDALVTNWHGQKPIAVPGGSVSRKDDLIIIRKTIW